MSTLALWTIYRDPADYPGKVVVRAHRIGADTVTPDREPLAVVDTIERARSAVLVAGGEVCVGRSPEDEPQIVESWV